MDELRRAVEAGDLRACVAAAVRAYRRRYRPAGGMAAVTFLGRPGEPAETLVVDDTEQEGDGPGGEPAPPPGLRLVG